MKTYRIKKNYLILNDQESVKSHVKKEDYFGTIATILSLIEQDLNSLKTNNKKELLKINQTLKNLEKDLLYLQKNYQINNKNK